MTSAAILALTLALWPTSWQEHATTDADAVTYRIRLGGRDKEATVWTGRFQVDGGKLLQVEVWNRGRTDQLQPDGRFRIASKQVAGRKSVIQEAGLLLTVEAAAQITLFMNERQRTFGAADVSWDRPYLFLRGAVQVERVMDSRLFLQRELDDDRPATVALDGNLFIAYVAHTPRGKRHLNPYFEPPRNLTSLRPTGGGDRLELTGRTDEGWQVPVPLTASGLDVMAPAIAAGKDRVHVVWSQGGEQSFELWVTEYDPATGRATPPVRLTRNDVPDLEPCLAVAANGDPWLAWRTVIDGHFAVQVARLTEEGIRDVHSLGHGDGSQWSPAIVAGREGQVFVAHDLYRNGSYDVQLATFSSDAPDQPPAIQVLADSARFEARPHLALDPEQGLWITYEVRPVDWGMDRLGADRDQTTGLLYDGAVQIVVRKLGAGALPDPDPDRDSRHALLPSRPHLTFTARGDLWLSYRIHSETVGQLGTVFDTQVQRWTEEGWSAPWVLPDTDHSLERSFPLIATRNGAVLSVHSTDGRRSRARNPGRINSDLVICELPSTATTGIPVIPADASDPVVLEGRSRHDASRQAAAVERMRAARLVVNDRTYRYLRGDFHRHTDFSVDGGEDGGLEELWRYAKDVAALDWIVCTDHDSGGQEYTWWLTQQASDAVQHEGFLTLHGYERTVDPPVGHRNVLFAQRGIRPLPRLLPNSIVLSDDVNWNDLDLLDRYLEEFDGLCAAHTTGTVEMGLEWRRINPEREPVVEIYQGCRNSYEMVGAPRAVPSETNNGGGVYEPGFVVEALRQGHRLGFFASSDHTSTHSSYAIVLVEEATRDGIMDALRQRHCYGATDDILLEVTCAGHIMGDDFQHEGAPTLAIRVVGTAAIRRVVIVRDGEEVSVTEPGTEVVEFEWQDPAWTDAGHWYYLRVEQGDGELAWGSPMWIRPAN